VRSLYSEAALDAGAASAGPPALSLFLIIVRVLKFFDHTVANRKEHQLLRALSSRGVCEGCVLWSSEWPPRAPATFKDTVYARAGCFWAILA
jgi:hypothetical protein